ncbi:hypothetical protein LG299_10845 [Microbacterium lacus]|uniref:hypothetical protein n=1 Tax=Microbacterium lacus TaxID=415217 RepID=UPI00385045D6
MSGDLDIRSGGAIAVDTESLRQAADGFDIMARELDDTVRMATDAAADLSALSWLTPAAARHADHLCAQVREAANRSRDSASGLRTTAALYESAELDAQLVIAQAAGDTDAVRQILARQVALEAMYPGLETLLRDLSLAHGNDWANGLLRDATGGLGGLLGPPSLVGIGAGGTAALAALMLGVRSIGNGPVPRGTKLAGSPSQVTVAPLKTGPAVAPVSLAAMVARVPGGSDARVRVETYAMPGGTKQYVVYVAGTQPPKLRDPFDHISNLQLYSGNRSASFDATLEALRAAGAQPGDTVHAVGHSQGAMIAAHLALDSEFDTKTLLSIGSPVEADLDDATLSISLRHTDDPVSVLAAGGHAQTVGAPGSLLVGRDASDSLGITFDAHHLTEYVETAKMMDASTDPRMRGVHDLLDELGGAASVTVTEYSAMRGSAVPVGRWTPVSPSADAG